jgi:hypothetical protein
MKIQSKLERCSLKQNLVFELNKKNAAEAQRKKSSAGHSIYLDSKLLIVIYGLNQFLGHLGRST